MRLYIAEFYRMVVVVFNTLDVLGVTAVYTVVYISSNTM